MRLTFTKKYKQKSYLFSVMVDKWDICLSLSTSKSTFSSPLSCGGGEGDVFGGMTNLKNSKQTADNINNNYMILKINNKVHTEHLRKWLWGPHQYLLETEWNFHLPLAFFRLKKQIHASFKKIIFFNNISFCDLPVEPTLVSEGLRDRLLATAISLA